MKNLLFAFFVILFSIPAVAEEEKTKPLTGEYYFAQGEPMEESDKPLNPNMRIHLTGTAAEDLYKKLQVKGVRDVCLDDGTITKQAQNIQCSVSSNGTTYSCWFGIDLKTQKIKNGIIC
ncbi:hypothetical protein GCM10011613_23450 [Cellvibrio zantedeschiae]|uniref:Uncharacterized protein n=1 Tax=Cellvibrio zantedeschiae TaxID=1237077 RepID=A0ABQ3B4M4_9GAMM|nr:hypothetical protein [Cellvibrio zantedeschiae]GGY78166.1 hypothetical protein GCM10011613_23450 [Cellvibrio zantedeschiae]